MPYKCPKRHNRDLKRRYGITRRVYEAILKGQEYKCAICEKHVDECGPLVMEHDHETDVLRGACCGPCNAVLGFAKEDPEILRKAIKFLEES